MSSLLVKRLRSSQSGQAIIEFVATFGLFVLLIFSAFSIWAAMNARITLTDATREAARAAAVAPANSSALTQPSSAELDAAKQTASQVLQKSGLTMSNPASSGWQPFISNCGGTSSSAFNSGSCDYYVSKSTISGMRYVTVQLRYRQNTIFPGLPIFMGGQWHYYDLKTSVVFLDER